MWWPGFELGDNPTLWDPATNANTAVPKVGANIFCSGNAFLADGRLLVTGGHVVNYVGLPNAYISELIPSLPEIEQNHLSRREG